MQEGDTLNIKYNSYYIAGGTPSTVYLGNYTAPLHVLQVDLNSLDTLHVRLKTQGIEEQKFWAARVSVDSPFYYFTDGAVPIIFRGNAHSWNGSRYLNDSAYFRTFVPINERSFVLKSLSGKTGENILGKLTDWPPYQNFTDKILEKQIDGVFCTDGMVLVQKGLDRIVYLYYYRNEFLVMDSSLSLQYKGHTIDATSHAAIEVATIASENSKVLAGPPLLVNKQSCASGNWLFVNSNLIAKNENPKSYKKASVIDVYDLKNGTTPLVFIYTIIGAPNRWLKFKVYGDKMVALYGSLMRVFKLTPAFFTSREREHDCSKDILPMRTECS